MLISSVALSKATECNLVIKKVEEHSSSDFASTTEIYSSVSGKECLDNARLINRGRSLQIPFRYSNGFLIVDVLVNRLPLSFIFDTGSKHTILTEYKLVPLLGQLPQEEIQIIGSDLGKPVTGRIMRRTALQVGSVNLENQSLIIIDSDVLDLNGLTGEKIQGIFGVGAFGAYALKIDYKRQLIELLDPSALAPTKRTAVLPIRVEKSKAYVDVDAEIHPGRKQKLSLLIDTGASLSVLINTNSADSTLFPPKLVSGTFGYGLGGYLFGFVGRSDQISIGPFRTSDVITHFQIIENDSSAHKLPVREGIIGNGILDRYTLIIDFGSKELHLLSTKKNKKPTVYDRSGMRLIRSGEKLNQIRVQHIVKNSPADRAGILIGDELFKVQGISCSLRGLSQSENLLKGRTGKKIRVKLKRNGKLIKTAFALEKLI